MSQTAVHVTTPLSPSKQLDPDNLPTAGDPTVICPDLAAYWEARLNGRTTAESFEDWLLIQDQIDEMWMNYRAKEIARSEKALVRGYKAAFTYFAEVSSSTPDFAPATAVSEVIPSIVIHKVTAPPTSPDTTALPSYVAPVYRTCRQARRPKTVAPHDTRFLDKEESRQVNRGVRPKSVRNLRVLKLSRKQAGKLKGILLRQ